MSKYKRLNHIEHVYLRPGMYVGDITNNESDLFLYNNLTNKIEKKTVLFNKGFAKLYDEILTNASDHAIRTKKVKNIWIDVNDKSVKIKNDGPGIDIKKQDNIWIPQMLFAELLTSENYDDSVDRVVGGLNGLGAALVNIFSDKFIINCADGKKKYVQVCEKGLSKINKPKITDIKQSYTEIEYFPDFEKFNLTEIDENMLSFFKTRAIDTSAYLGNVNVYFNGELIKVKNIKDLVSSYYNNTVEYFEEVIDKNYKIAIVENKEDIFAQTSILNGISTYEGGTHVNNIANQLVSGLSEILTKGKKSIKVSPSDIKNRIHLFIICSIPNPLFTSQTKETLSMRLPYSPKIGSKLFNQLSKSNIMKSIKEWIELKQQASLKKLNNKVAGKTLRVDKLIDAHKAGTKDSDKCGLFITEGDSALGGVVAGMSEISRDHWGAFPIRGRFLNIREMEISKVLQNKEVADLLKIIGLVPGTKYKSLSELRYGKLVFFTDADCLDENTIIWTKDGDKKMKDLTYLDEVMTHDGSYKPIINIINKDHDKVVKLTINGVEYLCSEFHKWIIIRDDKTMEVYAKDIINTDKVLVKKRS